MFDKKLRVQNQKNKNVDDLNIKQTWKITISFKSDHRMNKDQQKFD